MAIVLICPYEVDSLWSITVIPNLIGDLEFGPDNSLFANARLPMGLGSDSNVFVIYQFFIPPTPLQPTPLLQSSDQPLAQRV